MNRKVSTVIKWAARTLGILLLAALVGLILNSAVRIRPETEENIGFVLLIMVGVVLLCFLAVFLVIAWKRETLGSILYLTFSAVLYLVILAGDLFSEHAESYGFLYLYSAPIVITGLLFLISGLINRAKRKEDATSARTPAD